MSQAETRFEIRTTADVEQALRALMAYESGSEEIEDALFDTLMSVQAYRDAGIMTRDNGLVLRFANGAEFQVTIVQSAQVRDLGR